MSAGDPHRARFCAARAARSVVTAAQPVFAAAPARATTRAHRFLIAGAEVVKATKACVAGDASPVEGTRAGPAMRGRTAARGRAIARGRRSTPGQGVAVSQAMWWRAAAGCTTVARRRAPTARGRTAPTGFLGSLLICSASFSPTSNKEVVRSHDCLEACSIRHGNKVVPRKRRPYILFSFMSNLMGFPPAPTLPNRRGVASFRKSCSWAGGWAHASCSLLVALRR